MYDFEYIEGVRVEVDEVVYMPSLHSPADKPHPFVYFITVYNDSESVIQVLGRKWIVTESDSSCVVVEGEGVIGEKPVIVPGESFSYNSYHVVARTGVAEGALYGVAEGEKFMVAIPEFYLNCP